jgi:hypothetical protein
MEIPQLRNKVFGLLIDELLKPDVCYERKEDVNKELDALIDEILKIEPIFIQSTALYARYGLHLRGVALYMAAKYGNAGIGRENSRCFVGSITNSPDDIAELVIQCRILGRDKPLSNFIKNGIKRAFSLYSKAEYLEYEDRSDVNLKKIMAICHPKPVTPEENNAYLAVLNEEYKNRPITLKKIYGNPDIIPHLDVDTIQNELMDEEKIIKSKINPFEFMDMYLRIKAPNLDPWAERALAFAMDISFERFITATISGNTLIILNGSNYLSGLFGIVASPACSNSNIYVYGDRIKEIAIKRNNSALNNASDITKVNVGEGNNASAVISEAIRKNKNYDRIIILGNADVYTAKNRKKESVKNVFIEYCKKVNSKALLYCIDVESEITGKLPSPARNVSLIKGLSPKLLTYINMKEHFNSKR